MLLRSQTERYPWHLDCQTCCPSPPQGQRVNGSRCRDSNPRHIFLRGCQDPSAPLPALYFKTVNECAKSPGSKKVTFEGVSSFLRSPNVTQATNDWEYISCNQDASWFDDMSCIFSQTWVVWFAGAARATSFASGIPSRQTATPRMAPATSSTSQMWPKRPTPKPSLGPRDARRDRS